MNALINKEIEYERKIDDDHAITKKGTIMAVSNDYSHFYLLILNEDNRLETIDVGYRVNEKIKFLEPRTSKEPFDRFANIDLS